MEHAVLATLPERKFSTSNPDEQRPCIRTNGHGTVPQFGGPENIKSVPARRRKVRLCLEAVCRKVGCSGRLRRPPAPPWMNGVPDIPVRTCTPFAAFRFRPSRRAIRHRFRQPARAVPVPGPRPDDLPGGGVHAAAREAASAPAAGRMAGGRPGPYVASSGHEPPEDRDRGHVGVPPPCKLAGLGYKRARPARTGVGLGPFPVVCRIQLLQRRLRAAAIS